MFVSYNSSTKVIIWVDEREWACRKRAKKLSTPDYWAWEETIKDSDGKIVYEGVYEHFTKTDEGQTWEQTGTEPLYQELDYSRLVPLLVKTIQELEARIATLEG